MEIDLKALRAATEDDVERAVEASYAKWKFYDGRVNAIITEVELLEFFNRMLDVLTGEPGT